MHPSRSVDRAARAAAPDDGVAAKTVRYRSLDKVSYFDANVIARRADGSVDLEVTYPGRSDLMVLTRIKIGTAPGECQEL